MCSIEDKKIEGLEVTENECNQQCNNGLKLSNTDINRYSRQIILPNVGVAGQVKLQDSSVLIVGAGGLGCPCSLYLAGGGVGRIGIVDYDQVELNNLHRQLLHSEESVGDSKVLSAKKALERINSNLKITPYHVQLDSKNALDIIRSYDVIVDATDNVATRYLLNDACVLLSKPLVSGSALQMEGQLTIYNYKSGPCYRCIFPDPPPPESVTNCGDGGVLGAIPGVIGVLQALETIKIILNEDEILSSHLLLFDGSSCTFRKIKLRNRRKDCVVCGEHPSIKELINYEEFCQSKANDKDPNLQILPESKRISVEYFSKMRINPHVLIDVRSKEEFEICHLPNSVNLPINKLHLEPSIALITSRLEDDKKKQGKDIPVFVICRRGNDSQKAVLQIEKIIPDSEIKDIIGGLHKWAAVIDNEFPVY